MHAFLLVGKNQKKILEKAESIATNLKADFLPFTLQKIIDAKQLSAFTRLKRSQTVLFIENIENATTETLNAFLKTLEESQNISFILTTKNEAAVLSTIVSRCQVIRVIDPESDSQHENLINNTVAERLEKFKLIKEREDAISLLEDLVYKLNSELVSGSDIKRTAKAIRMAEKTIQALKANGNVTLQLANFAINL